MKDKDWFGQAIADVVSDVRQKVIEEPWFGRAVTEKVQEVELPITELAQQKVKLTREMSVELGWFGPAREQTNAPLVEQDRER